MHPMNPESVLSALRWRYAVKKFDASKKIPEGTWSALEQATILTPSSFGLQLWRFVVVTDAAVKATLRPLSWNQPQITDASHLLVLCRQTSVGEADVERYVADIAATRKVPAAALDGYKQMMLGFIKAPGVDHAAWMSKQVYIALGFFLASAAAMGVDACPMEGIDPAGYDRALGLAEKGCATVVVAAAGYRSEQDELAKAAKVRYPADRLIIRV